MPRLIDADALLDAMRDEEFQTFVPLDEIDSVIDKAPTIDAEPVRHGRWIRNDLGETYCSECNNRIPFVECFDFYPDCCMDDDDMQWNEEIDKTNYCPNCGAKMDAKDNNAPTNEPNKICPINGAPCNECVPGAYCAKMDGGACGG